MKAKYIVLLFILLPIIQISAQQGKAEFDQTSHEFGDMQEEDGPQEVTFNFTNKGSSPITLTYVKASCGCTTPSWTTEAIAPGGTGFVKASYNPEGRPGAFKKSITIRTDGTPQAMVLRISGNVIPRPKGVKDYYPHSVGGLRFQHGYVSFGDVWHDSTKTFKMGVYNDSGNPIALDLANSRLPIYVTAAANKVEIQSKDSATVTFTFDGVARKDWGFTYGGIFLKTNDIQDSEKRLGFSANVKENFTKLPASTLHPKVVFDETDHDFGQIDQHGKVSYKFMFKNTGKGELVIRKTISSCGCTVAALSKEKLAPGETAYVEIHFSAGSRQGIQKKSITIITNDPEQDEVILWINSEVMMPTNKPD